MKSKQIMIIFMVLWVFVQAQSFGQSDFITLPVDDVSQIAAAREQERQDSIKQINETRKAELEKKIKEIQDIEAKVIGIQKDTAKPIEERIKELKGCKIEIEAYNDPRLDEWMKESGSSIESEYRKFKHIIAAVPQKIEEWITEQQKVEEKRKEEAQQKRQDLFIMLGIAAGIIALVFIPLYRELMRQKEMKKQKKIQKEYEEEIKRQQRLADAKANGTKFKITKNKIN